MADTLLGGIVFNEVMAVPNSAMVSSGAHIDTDIHMLLAEHSVLLVKGTEVESLYLGQEAGRALGIGAMEEIRQISDISGDIDAGYPNTLPMLKVGEAPQAPTPAQQICLERLNIATARGAQ